MANPWFRLYSEAVDDEKLRLLAFEDRWHFIALLCCKNNGILDTEPGLMRRKVAVKLGLDLRELGEVARRLAEVGLIDEESMQPLKWNDRQFKSDTSAERTRAYRDRMKRDGDVTVTAQESDTDTDTEQKQIKTKSKDMARGSRLPADWTLPKEWGEWALSERPELNREAIRKIADQFRDYWISVPGQRGVKLDWLATWRNRVRDVKVNTAPGKEKFDPLAYVNRNRIYPNQSEYDETIIEH
jgi:hypothetical protein